MLAVRGVVVDESKQRIPQEKKQKVQGGQFEQIVIPPRRAPFSRYLGHRGGVLSIGPGPVPFLPTTPQPSDPCFTNSSSWPRTKEEILGVTTGGGGDYVLLPSPT